jgi:hypothetical protein
MSIAPTAGERGASAPPTRVTRFVAAATMLAGLAVSGFGVWALASPLTFAELIDFAPYNEHLLHDVGSFQIGIGATLLLALRWRDSLAVSLAGFVVGGSLHAISHLADLHLGGHVSDVLGLGGLALLCALALAMRLRHLRASVEDPPLPKTQSHEV